MLGVVCAKHCIKRRTLGPSQPAKHPDAVKSPMVGAAYRSPKSGAHLHRGRHARLAGRLLLIIEAMKTKNQIPPPHAGKVTAVLIENGQPVECGEPLVIIE